MAIEHVSGRDAGQIILYALRTCVWCNRTRQLLDELGVAYDYEYVDFLQGSERAEAMAAVKRWNPSVSFPNLVINNRCIVGFKEKEIREALKL